MPDCISGVPHTPIRRATDSGAGDVTPRVRVPARTWVLHWLGRLALVTVGLALLGLALPLFSAADRAAFEAVNGVGYGRDWVFEVLDPHERIYRGLLLLAIIVAFVARGPWAALGVAIALVTAGTVSFLMLEVIATLTGRPRPQEVLENILKPPGAGWAQASYPSGHVVVTTTLAAAAARALPVLRWPMAFVVVVIAWSRVAFGAHFPLDVLAGALLGYATAAFAVAFTAQLGLLARAHDDPHSVR